MRKKIIVSLLLVAILCASLTMVFTGCKKKPSPPVDVSNIQVFMDGEYYIGNQSYKKGELVTENTLDLSKHFPIDSTFNPSGNKVSISGTVMTVNDKSGNFNMEVKYTKEGKEVEEELKVFIIEGINVYTFEELYYAASQAKNIIVQSDMILDRANNIENALVDNSNLSIMLKANLYGNGHLLDATPIAEPVDKKTDGVGVFYADGENILIQDVKVIGKNMDNIDPITFDVSNLERYGRLINFDGDGSKKISGTIKNCIIENSHKLVFINAADVKMEGCIVRNGADTLVSIQTNNEGGSKIVLKNNVLINSIVAGVVFWGMDPITDDANYVDLTIEGFLDIYNWKESSNAKLMPSTEDFADLVNSMVSGQFNNKEYEPYMYYKGEEKWVHSAIIVLSTKPCKQNKATINGQFIDGLENPTDKIAVPNTPFLNRGFPLPPIANTIAVTTCRIVGLGNNSEVQDSDVKPGDSIADNANIYRELRDGRKAK